MQFERVLVLVTGDTADAPSVSHAASLVRESRGNLIILYVITVDRSLPLDSEMPNEVAVAERVLDGSDSELDLPRNAIESEILQARQIGPAVVHEAAVRDVDAVVIGTRYPRQNGQFSLGTDIPYILEYAACHVILLREALAGARPERRMLTGRSGTGAS